ADTILGDFQQDGGTLAPGDSPGLTEIQGNYDMNGGIIEFEFAGGANPFVDYDSIKVEGVATLSGMLDIDLIYPAGGTSPFAPVLGDSFLIVDADGGIQGMPEFDFSGAGLSSGLAWNTNDFSSTGRISIIAAVPEPTGALLLALTSCSILLRRRRSC
ncbi:MAG: PEP-CTERM sorting domain-containing protein, partial [Pirellulaceae bacterium]